jgi:hypothetical protein
LLVKSKETSFPSRIDNENWVDNEKSFDDKNIAMNVELRHSDSAMAVFLTQCRLREKLKQENDKESVESMQNNAAVSATHFASD